MQHFAGYASVVRKKLNRYNSTSSRNAAAENRNSGVSIVLYLAYHRCSGVEANTHLRSHTVFGFEFGSGFFETLQDREGRPTSP
jgi:hypothetical protein